MANLCDYLVKETTHTAHTHTHTHTHMYIYVYIVESRNLIPLCINNNVVLLRLLLIRGKEHLLL